MKIEQTRHDLGYVVRTHMSRVVIAGAGAIGQALAAKLAVSHDVRAVCAHGDLPAPTERLSWFQADLTTIHRAEIALTGAHTVVLLAQAKKPFARLLRASLDDVDCLMADAVGRAARLVDAKHVVLFSCGESDVRPALLERAGVPLSVLRGGAPDPIEALANLVEEGPGKEMLPSAAWAGAEVKEKPPQFSTCSVQRFIRPSGWSALDVARAYFQWLPSSVATVRTTHSAGVFTVYVAGMRALVLRLVPGRSSDECAYLEVADGSVVAHAAGEARFEFRILLDRVTLIAALMGFESALPWPVYRLTQAALHERAMRQFSVWLAEQQGQFLEPTT